MFSSTYPFGHPCLQVGIVQGQHMQHPDHAYGSVLLLENASPGWSTHSTLLSPRKGGQRYLTKAVSLKTMERKGQEMDQMTFKLLSNPNMLIASYAHLVHMLSTWSNNKIFKWKCPLECPQTELVRRMWVREAIISGLGTAWEGRGKHRAQTSGRNIGVQETKQSGSFSKLSFRFPELTREASPFLSANFSSPPGTKGPSLKVTIMKALQGC